MADKEKNHPRKTEETGEKVTAKKGGEMTRQGNGHGSQGREMSAPYRRGGLFDRGGWEPFRRMREEFDRVFDQFFPNMPTPWTGGQGDWRWGFDVQEDEKSVTVRAEAPGFEPDDFDLQVHGDQLIMRATHKAENEEKEGGYRQWRHQEFYRSVPLPAGLDAEHVEAEYRHGVLSITLPKTEQAKGRRIAVRGG
jgi:HSP20 family protein